MEIALSYLPESVFLELDGNLAVLAVGSVGACRLTDQYRERELVIISDWLFPPSGDTEAEDTGRFFIVSLLHEVAHALSRHRSPKLDGLSAEECRAQEDEADLLAIDWFNHHVTSREHPDLRIVEGDEFREMVERFAALLDHLEQEIVRCHRRVVATSRTP
jgi:hypothetical protein